MADYASFVNAFWSVKGEEALLSHITTSSTSLSDLRTVFKDLANLEKDYAKQLKKISSLPIGKDEPGLGATLTEFKASLLARSETHEKLAQDVALSLEAKVKDHEANRETRKRKHQAAVTNLHKSKLKMEQECTDRKDRYKSDALAIRSYNTQLNLLKRKDLNKVKSELEKAKKSIKKTETDYKSACKQMKETCRNFELEWKGFCDLAEDLEEDRIHCVREALVQYTSLYGQLSEADALPVKRLRVSMDSWDTADAVAAFVNQKSVGGLMQVAPEFINFAEGEEESSTPKTRTACFTRSSFRYPGAHALHPSSSSNSLNQPNTPTGYDSPSPAASPLKDQPHMDEYETIEPSKMVRQPLNESGLATPPHSRVSRIRSEAQPSPTGNRSSPTPLKESGTMLSIGNHLFPVEVSPENRNAPLKDEDSPISRRARSSLPEKEDLPGENGVLRALENMNGRVAAKRGNLPTPPPQRRQGSDPTISPAHIRRPVGLQESHHAHSFPKRVVSGDRGFPSSAEKPKSWAEKRTASPAALAYSATPPDTLFDPVLSPPGRYARSASPNPARAPSPNPAYNRTPSPFVANPADRFEYQNRQSQANHLLPPGQGEAIRRSPSPSHHRHGSLPLSPSTPALSTFARHVEPPSVNNASRPTFNRQRSQSVQNLDQYYHQQQRQQPSPSPLSPPPSTSGYASPTSPTHWQSPLQQSFASHHLQHQSPTPSQLYHSPSQPNLVHRVQQQVLFYVQAAHPYSAIRPDELTLQAGDEIAVLEQGADGWWTGRLSGVIGKFPSTFVNM